MAMRPIATRGALMHFLSWELIVRTLLASLAIFVFSVMHSIAAAVDMKTASGWPAFIYNASSIPCVFLFALSVYSLGARVVSASSLRAKADIFLIRTACGYAFMIVLGYAVGLLNLLYPAVSIAILCLPLIVFPKDSLSFKTWSSKQLLLLGALCCLMVYLLAFSGILDVYVENDFAHYFPMFEIVLESHSLQPNVAFLPYFYMKGNGALFLLMSATSIMSAKMVTIYALGVLFVVVFRLCGMMTGMLSASIAGALLLLATKLMKIEAYKGHVNISMCLLLLIYLLVKAMRKRQGMRSEYVKAVMCILVAIVLVSPVAVIFLSVPLAYFVFCSFLGTSRLGRLESLCVASLAPIAFIVVVGSNYLLSGMPEVTPLSLWLPYFDTGRVNEWLPRYGVIFADVESRLAQGGVHKTSRPYDVVLVVAGALAGWCAIFMLYKKWKPVLLRRISSVVIPVACLGVLCPVLLAFVDQSSFSRYVAFYSAIQMIYVVCAVALLVPLFTWLLSRTLKVHVKERKVYHVLFAMASAYAILFNWTPGLSFQGLYTSVFWGAAAPSKLFGHWYDHAAVALHRNKQANVKAYPLYFAPYAYYLDRDFFIRPFFDRRTGDSPLMLSANPEVAKAEYHRHGIDSFVMDLSPNVPLMHAAFGGLFTPVAIQDNFNVEPLGADKWLLTFSGTRTQSTAARDFLVRYSAKRKMEYTNIRNVHYRALVEVSKSHPEYVISLENSEP